MNIIKRYILFLFVALCSILAFSQSKEPTLVIRIPYADTIPQELIDSIYRQEGQYILSYHPKMAHLIPEMRCRLDKTPGRRIGVFSVAKDRQVSFSQGNLQYILKNKEWRFANNQWDYVGADNVQNGRLGPRIDLFGWSGKDSKAPFGVSTSTNNADYAGEFVDWGTNVIQGDAAGRWRTLSKDEWEYLIKGRKNASNLIGVAQVNEVNGLILLPDDWVCPNEITIKFGFYNENGIENYKSYQTFTRNQWLKLEESGAIFLPAAGVHDGPNISNVQHSGYYWSSTNNGINYAYSLFCYSAGVYISYDNRYDVRSVRLVHDTVVPPPAPCRTIDVNGIKINMMCVEGGTFMMGAGSEAHQVTLSDYMIAQTELTQGVWEAVMGREYDKILTTNKVDVINKGADYPAYGLTWYDCHEFITRLNQLTGLDFRLPTEAEWEFAARGGNNSKGFKYSGSDNLNEIAWYALNSDNLMHPVAQLKSNELGIYDMTGNAWELCLDGYAPYSTYPQTNPLVPFKNEVVARGGSSYNGWSEDVCLITHRLRRTPNAERTRNTLRLVLSDEVKVKTIVVGDNAFNMIAVDGGLFMMGDTIKGTNAAPIHKVTLSDYYIAQTELTQALYQYVMGSLPKQNIYGDNIPVERLTLDDCQMLCDSLNKLTGLHFRIPTEAEWEFAARGGNKSKGYKYAGSNNLEEVAWYQKNASGKLREVAQLSPNELGIYDMTGNAWSWVSDRYSDEYDTTCSINPTGPTSGDMYIIRGGCVCRDNERVLLSYRYKIKNKADYHVGFRLVMDNHQYVDLGLSVMWAICNVGASSPEEYGDHFAWGETEPKAEYKWETYKWCNGTDSSITKYCSNSKYGDNGFVDNKTELELEDDVAHVNWGGEWRMATKKEFQELIDNCCWETATYNGVNGYKITSTIPGYTDRSIFLPRAGFYNDDLGNNSKGAACRYWTSNGTSSSATNLWEGKLTGNTRRCGFSVRPVLPTERAIQSYKPTPGKRIGVFSVGKNKQVSFSQGNLIYLKIKDQWQFADNQWDYTGERHLRNGQIADTVMYFGWSAKDSKAPWGISLSTKLDYYKGESLEWGSNIIQGDAPNTWRTMSNDELMYLFTERKNADQLLGRGKVGDINGIVLLPDEWVMPEGLQFMPIADNVINNYTVEQWAKMESAGAVFIPAAGYFNNQLEPKMRFVNEDSYVASSILKDSTWQIYSVFASDNISYSTTGTSPSNLHYAFPRRLVHDTIVPFEPEYVDLGLSVKWATCNVGASAPEEYGDYFAWGEVVPKTTYNWSTYKYCKGSSSTLTKYCNNSSYGNNGFTDNKTVLDLEDDAATVNWGGEWRMPTDAEMTELREKCTWTWTTQNGVKGYKVVGPNGNSIFLPAAGYMRNSDLTDAGSYGYDWSSSLRSDNPSFAYGVYFNSDIVYWHYNKRYYGRSVRPVMPTDREPLPPLTPAKRIGVFSVAKDRQVSFSQGNLQYFQSHDHWRFADNQWDYIGADNVKDGALANRIDLFGWSGKDSKAPFGVSTSTNNADYAGEFVDWGTNVIQGDAAGTWRTLSKEEWEYLVEGRRNAENLIGVAQVNGVNGLIILPDDWVCPKEVLFKPGFHKKDGGEYYALYQSYTIAEWKLLEEKGAIFLPAAGIIYNSPQIITGLAEGAHYQSSSRENENSSFWLGFRSSYYVVNSSACQANRSVRLVHDTIVPPPAPCREIEVNGVTFNMMCVEGGTFRMGKGKDEHQVTLSDYYIGETEVTQGLWKAVMEVDKLKGQNVYGDDYPVANMSLNECEIFIQRLSQITGRHFRIPTEAEWEYAARGGQKSKGFTYSGSDNLAEVAIYRDILPKDDNGQLIHKQELVKSRKSNELGIYEMSGNLCEWVSDWAGPYNTYPQLNPIGVAFPQNSKHKYMVRGGCWNSNAMYCTPYCRQPFYGAANGVGLRLAMSDEEPFRAVYVNDTTRFYLRLVEGEKYDYYIGQTEVTQGFWEKVMGYNNSIVVGDDLPVEKVSWDECQQFIGRLNEMTGLHFRLPTEEEWEYAARGGNRSRGCSYAGSNNIDSVGWYSGNSEQTTHAVASLMPNELGVYDMTGNVWEWCQDFYDAGQTMHVVKSGSWFDAATTCRINARTGRAADYQSYIGLRLVMDVHEYVDLGLSVKWATCNVGAMVPEEYGDYFAWGEVEAKEEYNWANYKHGTAQNITKYNAEDGLTTLLPEDDAAHVNWGGEWRMPTIDEADELIQQCSWTWTQLNDVYGYKVTGPNGNSIFLPAAGYKGAGPSYPSGEDGLYWISDLHQKTYARLLVIQNDKIPVSVGKQGTRCYGFAVRPVRGK